MSKLDSISRNQDWYSVE